MKKRPRNNYFQSMFSLGKPFCFILLIFIFLCNSCNSRKDVHPEASTASESSNLRKNVPPIKQAEIRKIIQIQPYGQFPKELIDEVISGIKKMYKLDVKILPVALLPDMAFYPPRNRYIADSLLIDLNSKKTNEAFKIIGLTEKDISTDIPNWGIFGYGSVDGYTCVVSSFRLKKGVGELKVIERLIKIVNHEIGHTLGLNHCPVSLCLMEDGGDSIKSVDNATGKLCAGCRKKTQNYLVKPN